MQFHSCNSLNISSIIHQMIYLYSRRRRDAPQTHRKGVKLKIASRSYQLGLIKQTEKFYLTWSKRIVISLAEVARNQDFSLPHFTKVINIIITSVAVIITSELEIRVFRKLPWTGWRQHRGRVKIPKKWDTLFRLRGVKAYGNVFRW